MSVWNMYEEACAKQAFKTETGDERQVGVTIGIVEENYNQDMPGRIKVRIPVRDGESQIVRWAKVAVMYTGADWGQYFLPEKEDQVILAFEHGSIERPYVIGSVPRDKDRFIKSCATEKNELKKIITKHGSELVFEDCSEGEGKKDKISIKTAGGAVLFAMDNEKGNITLKDKDDKVSLVMEIEKGCITVKAEKKLILKAGDSAGITLNADSRTASIDADKVVIKAGNSLELKSQGQAKLTGQQTALEGSSMLKASSSGMVTIGGTPVKIG